MRVMYFLASEYLTFALRRVASTAASTFSPCDYTSSGGGGSISNINRGLGPL